ncbi:MAG TPA: ABC transporter permease [Acetobacteraceae bacterium]|jgi:peptide/nickel transport system permease protein|nr:ABC transporter permease [Acetobacteraceae bacterium]
MAFWRWLAARVGLLIAVVFTAASLNFLLPKLSPINPVETKLLQLQESGGALTDIHDLVQAYETKFGLGKPLLEQYGNYLASAARFDLGYSIAFYPARVIDLIKRALPWTIGLILTSTLIAFALGTLLGAVVAWEHAPRVLLFFAPGVMVLAALPYYLLGLVLVYLFAFSWPVFPLQGGFELTSTPNWSWSFVADVLWHSILPALSIVLASMGTWALTMRGMMITVQGEDYMNYALANGLPVRRRFFSYGLRNAMLPAVTGLALQIGHVAAGAVIVERIFGYPGLGTLLFEAIQQADYFVIYGVVFIIVVMIAAMMLLVDLVYPLLDPRIRLGAAR